MSKEVRKYCGHCEEILAPRTFREHARLYYDINSHTWTKKRRVDVDDELGDSDIHTHVLWLAILYNTVANAPHLGLVSQASPLSTYHSTRCIAHWHAKLHFSAISRGICIDQ